jgi:hypothetical protein
MIECFFGNDEPDAIVKLPPKPTVTTLCGSTRYPELFEVAARSETLAGRIVISVGLFGHQEAMDMGGPVKAMLDQLHFRKIDISDEILVLNPMSRVCPACKTVWRHDAIRIEKCSCGAEIGDLRPAGYIGESTRREIDYAMAKGKTVRYLNPDSEGK